MALNWSFKDGTRKHYDVWLNEDNHDLTPSGKMKRASESVIVEWISEAWKKVSAVDQIIVFKRLLIQCGRLRTR